MRTGLCKTVVECHYQLAHSRLDSLRLIYFSAGKWRMFRAHHLVRKPRVTMGLSPIAYVYVENLEFLNYHSTCLFFKKLRFFVVKKTRDFCSPCKFERIVEDLKLSKIPANILRYFNSFSQVQYVFFLGFIHTIPEATPGISVSPFRKCTFPLL